MSWFSTNLDEFGQDWSKKSKKNFGKNLVIWIFSLNSNKQGLKCGNTVGLAISLTFCVSGKFSFFPVFGELFNFNRLLSTEFSSKVNKKFFRFHIELTTNFLWWKYVLKKFRKKNYIKNILGDLGESWKFLREYWIQGTEWEKYRNFWRIIRLFHGKNARMIFNILLKVLFNDIYAFI